MLPAADNQYTATVSAAWNIGDNPNGGYLTSIVVHAMLDQLSTSAPQLVDPLSITTHYLRPGKGGQPAVIETEIVRVGRSVATLRATLKQEDKVCLTVLAMFGDLSTSPGVEHEFTITPPSMPEPADCIRRSGAAQGLELPLMQRLDVLLDPQFGTPGCSDQAVVQGWIRLADSTPPCSQVLPLFCDAFPPSAFTRLGMVGWVPTLELTVHVRRRPAPGWIKGRLESQDLVGGRMIESGVLWDSTGQVVAQSRQIGLVMNAD